MDAVAAAAGVGKGTVFRAFGDRTGLLRAVMAQRSADLVRAIETEAPPFEKHLTGPARVSAVLDALLDFKLGNRQLFLALDQVASGSPYQAENYGWWHELIAASLEKSAASDARFLAHALLATVRSDLLEHLLTEEALTAAEVKTRFLATIRRMLC